MSLDSASIFSKVAYNPPFWLIKGINNAILPQHKLNLGRFPTPVTNFNINHLIGDLDLNLFIKRDDLSSFDLSGNKVRKLEFLLSDAKEKGHDCTITIGGIQSNHCRATAVASRQIGLDPHLILRQSRREMEDEVGLTGNLLFDRMVGARIHTVSASAYAQIGSDNLCQQLADDLRKIGRNPYVIPVGGSNELGIYGYLECVNEIIQQSSESFDHIVFGCGSGGTLAGLALGVKLAGLNTKVHAIGVCDSPEYFYNHVEEMAAKLNVDLSALGPVRDWCTVYAGQGIGYAQSTEEELRFVLEVSQSTGVLLDPVYSGKGLFHFVTQVLQQNPGVFQRGQRVLFIHTGGTVGMYAKEAQLLPMLPKDQVTKMVVRPK